MTMLDQQIVVGDERTTLRRLGTERRLVLRRLDSFLSAPGRQVLFADIPEVYFEGRRGYEISEADYAELLKMDVPEDPT